MTTRAAGGPRGLFALDLRALAAMRIGMGLLLLVDLLVRATDFDAHYGDDGVLPRDVFVDTYLRFGRICLHAWMGESGQMVLWAIALVAACMLLFGYRTRTATIISWVLLASLHSRNYMVIQAGDTALRMMLLWSVFLPLGARWSVDAGLRGDDAPVLRIRTVATMALVAQIVAVYATATLSKMSHPVWWRDGLGVYYALSTEQFTTGLGVWLRDFTWLVKALNYVTLVVQASVPLLLLSPYRNEVTRTTAAAILIPMHIAFMLCLSIGLFSYIMVVFWVVVLPSGFWDRVEAQLRRLQERLPAPRGAWLEKARARRRDRPHPVVRVGTSRFARAFVGAALVYAMWWNASDNPALAMNETAQLPARVLRMEQRWYMFSNPPRESGWYVVAGELQTGGAVDPHTGKAPDFDEPELISATFPGQRWRKYMTNVERQQYRRHRTLYLDYLCRSWKERHPDRPMRRISLFKLVRETPPPGQDRPPIKRRRLSQRICRQ